MVLRAPVPPPALWSLRSAAPSRRWRRGPSRRRGFISIRCLR
ncbi:unnamed protein product [Linum tenue]|uniref:Uncharacterized protein n=1 Tax=Linum tenue TaxID=586396 RepID=A0AAV0LVK2_9ROSI|nr:unnamed protein product [Linum tenue]